MNSILVATDLSARSDRAVERAVRLASDRGATLTVVHVIDDGLPTTMANAQHHEAEENIQKHMASLAPDGTPEITIKVVFGRAYVDILDLSEKTDCDLIVLGVHREDTFKDMFRGTTAERVIRAGDIPVLLVKDRVTDPYRDIMVGVDFSVYSRRAIEFAVEFVPNGRFHLVHAYDVPFKGFLYGNNTRREVDRQHEAAFEEMIEGEMVSFVSSLNAGQPSFERIMREGTVREVIHRELDRLKPDLLVIGTHGRTGAAHALLGSVAEDLLRSPPCDVLAVKAW